MVTPATPPPRSSHCVRRRRVEGIALARRRRARSPQSRLLPTTGERDAALADLLRRVRRTRAATRSSSITGDMRIGLREGLVEEAIGVAFERPAAEVARAVMLLGDLGEVACLVARGEAWIGPGTSHRCASCSPHRSPTRRRRCAAWARRSGLRTNTTGSGASCTAAAIAWPCTAATSTRSPTSSPRWRRRQPRTPTT